MPVGVQCPASLPHIGEFGIAMALVSWAFARIGVHRPSLRFRLDVFHSLLSAIGFQSCFFFTADVSPPIRSRYTSLTHFLGEFPGLGLAMALVPDVVVTEAEQRCAWSRKLDPNFCPGRSRTSDLGI